jgi:hypothetical protein
MTHRLERVAFAAMHGLTCYTYPLKPYSETGTMWIQSRLNLLMVALSHEPETLSLLELGNPYKCQAVATSVSQGRVRTGLESMSNNEGMSAKITNVQKLAH